MTAETKFIMGMRDAFFEALYPLFQNDKRLAVVSADNGAPTLDKFFRDMPLQAFTVGIAEQEMMGLACGMAFEGRKVYTYAIAPFVTLRCYEQNKVDMCAMNLPVTNLGVGAGYAYDIMGPTHHTVEDITVMRALPNLTIYSPADSFSAAALAQISYKNDGPQYIRFDRAGIPDLYSKEKPDLSKGLIEARQGKDVYIVSTGVMVHTALSAAKRLEAKGINAGVLDVFRLKPMNEELLLSYANRVGSVVTLEEHRLIGGLGSAVTEVLVDRGLKIPILRIGQGDRFVFDNGGRNAIWEKYGLDEESVADRISGWMR